jgi:hypothetical protein
MIPYYARVAAFDDVPNHLELIVRGLGKAGFWAMPILYDGGMFEPELPSPLPGIRLVFTDIHMGQGPLASVPTFASNILNGLKKVVENGPYAVIFWSQYPEDAEAVWNEIAGRAAAAHVPLPVGFGVIDKSAVLDAGETDDEAEPVNRLRKLIISQVRKFETLAIVMSWDERVGRAAIDATNRLYSLAMTDKPTSTSSDPENGMPDHSVWTDLLTYLAQEAVGKNKAQISPISALDDALLPLLEDQLSRRSNYADVAENKLGRPIETKLKSSEKNLKRPTNISATALNTHYLIDIVDPGTSYIWERGMVTELGGAFRNSGQFIGFFGQNVDWLIKNEFVLPDSKLLKDVLTKAQLHIVELSAECDQVQEKVATHRYLLALKVPENLIDACKSKNNKYANESIKDIGNLQLPNQAENFHLLVSCRRFMVLPPKAKIDGVCRFRLRRSVIDELAHYYVTHSRRPGVMRFY